MLPDPPSGSATASPEPRAHHCHCKMTGLTAPTRTREWLKTGRTVDQAIGAVKSTHHNFCCSALPRWRCLLVAKKSGSDAGVEAGRHLLFAPALHRGRD